MARTERPINVYAKPKARPHVQYLIPAAILLAFAAVAVLHVKRRSLSIYDQLTHGGTTSGFGYIQTDSFGGEIYMGEFPERLFGETSKTVIIGGALSLVLCVTMSIYAFVSLHRGPILVPSWLKVMSITLIATNAFLALGCFIYISVIHYASSSFDPAYALRLRGPGGQVFHYDHGNFDLETWTCALNAFPVWIEDKHDMGLLCTYERATRWALVPLFFTATLFATIAIWCFLAEHTLAMRKFHEEKEGDTFPLREPTVP